MRTQHEANAPEPFATEEPESLTTEPARDARKAFVEPDISAPVDVLAATTFFNASTSGGSN
ncbi:MAG TPA: hypothetical protein VN228_01490 [Pyrinomonadaceae bacterium]|nr:hypothetical protein [Pyrinomonadaceae bacterium]